MTSVIALQPLRQFTRPQIAAVWIGAAVPMGLLAWAVVPLLFGSEPTPSSMVGLIAALTVGLAWQFVLAVGLVAFEQGTLRPSVLRRALWLNPPSTAGRRGGRLWLWLIPLVVASALIELIPFGIPEHPAHSFSAFLGSSAGRELLSGNWGLLVLIAAMFAFNTFLGEELLFRGLLLPRMRAAFGRADWVANGILFGVYHLHQPWSIPGAIVQGTLLLALPSLRLRSAWIGVIVHSAQSAFLLALIVALVLS